MTVLAALTVSAVLESTLPSFRLAYKMQDKEATVTILMVLAVLAVVAVSVVTATPVNSTPLCRHPDISAGGRKAVLGNTKPTRSFLT